MALPEVITQCFSPLDVCGAQLNRLGCNGEILQGTDDVKIACDLLDISLTPNTTPSRSDVARNGGQVKVAERVLPSVTEDYSLTMNLSPRIDVGLLELMGTHEAIVDDLGVYDWQAPGSRIGIKPYAAGEQGCACTNTQTCDNGVSLLVWFNNTALPANDKAPYVVFAFPMVKFAPNGSWDISDTYSNRQYIGTPETNAHWIDPTVYDDQALVAARGPGFIFPESIGLDVPWAAWVTATPAPGGCDCSSCNYEYTASAALGGVVDTEEIGISVGVTTTFTGTPDALVGDTIDFDYSISNPSATDGLTSILVNDAVAGVTDLAVADIAGGAGPAATGNQTYTVTAADVARGFVTTFAVVTALNVNGREVTNSVVTTVDLTP